MSHMGQSPTFLGIQRMSACPPIATTKPTSAEVRYVPEGDIAARRWGLTHAPQTSHLSRSKLAFQSLFCLGTICGPGAVSTKSLSPSDRSDDAPGQADTKLEGD